MTDGVASQVAAVFGGTEQLTTMSDGAKRMLADAQAGHWAVDEETGSHLHRAVTQMQTELGRISPKIYRLKQAPKFGDDEYARKASAHFLEAMYSDDRSLVRVYEQAQMMLETLREAIDIAISKYNGSDDAATQDLRTLRTQEDNCG
ncbi:hypothetical protein [Amycolatopsis viridis]|uniref:Uncharacterized protein n=1 Tax=Amycolatopsis viridis TaxID=185678 RepID=A0ABX0SLX3_9PSEU|nr:hypothetical protein [Amycolatopsis viridis]NIH77544.1 hypothetical protein [Amycolatopsis viridis]